MDNIFEEVMEEVKNAVREFRDSRELYEAKMRFLGRTGRLTALYKKIREIPAEERPSFGQKINALKEQIEARFAALEEELRQKELAEKLAGESRHARQEYAHRRVRGHGLRSV